MTLVCAICLSLLNTVPGLLSTSVHIQYVTIRPCLQTSADLPFSLCPPDAPGLSVSIFTCSPASYFLTPELPCSLTHLFLNSLIRFLVLIQAFSPQSVWDHLLLFLCSLVLLSIYLCSCYLSLNSYCLYCSACLLIHPSACKPVFIY